MEKNTDIQKLIDNINAPSREIKKILQPIKTIQDSMKPVIRLQEMGKPFKSVQETMNSLSYSLSQIPTISSFVEMFADQQQKIDEIAGTFYQFNVNIMPNDFFNNLTELTAMIEILEKDRKEYEKNYFGQLADEELKEKEDVIARLKEEKEAEKLKYEEEKKVWEKQCADLVFLKKIAGEALVNAMKDNERKQSLMPSLTKDQIIKIYIQTQWMFNATLEQWQNVFSETIKKTDKPIVLQSGYLSDLVNFFELLKIKGFINSGMYAAIIEKNTLFENENGIITSLQIRQAKKDTKGKGYGGKNYEKIEEIIENL